jgi:filamentous hemagglutinin
VVPTATSLPGARSVDPLGPAFTLPSGGLFRVSAPNPSYLIETDPRFADYRAFISSDYMLSRLALSPGTTTKRLGDGFYEARLVRDEIYRLSGRRYLSAYSSDTEQFQALMENGIAVAAALQLSPGISLTAEQMVALTHDIVWLEEREVALPDGRVERVLVPVVYLAATDPGDLKPSGALIAANDLVLRTTDAVTNSGIIRGGERALVDAGSVRNIGGTIASRGLTDVTAQTDVVNRSGVIRGGDVSVMAGRDIRNETAVQQLTAGNAAIGATSTLISRRGAITAERDAVVAAGRDVVISGAEVRAGGDAAIGAGGSVTLDTVEARQGRHLYLGGSHSVTESTSQIGSAVGAGNDASIGAQGDVTLRAAGVAAGRDLTLQAGGDIGVGAARDTVSYDAESRGRKGSYGIVRTYDETVVGSSLSAGRDVTLAAGSGGAAAASRVAPDSVGNITVTGSSIGSDAGAIALVAPGNVTVEAESERHTRFAESVSKSRSAFSKKTVEERHSSDLTLARSATVSGESVTIVAGESVTVRGSNVVAADDVAIAAAKDLTITTAQQSLAAESYRSEKKSGAFSSGGFGITVGKQSITERETEDSLTNLGSTVGSVQGRATLVAGEAYRQSGSEVLAPRGIDISARDVAIDAAQDTFRTTYSYEAKQSGLSVGLAGGVVSPLVTAKDSIDRRSEVEDDRLKAVYAYRAGRNVYEAGTQAAEAMAGNKAFFEVQVRIGSSPQRVDSQTDAARAVGSTVASAGDVAIAATGGAPGSGNLAVTGSSVTGANVALSAANELALRAAANTGTSQTIESGKAGSMGVGFGVGGKGAGISVFASASRMSGNTAGDSTTWTETQITAADLLVLQSGGDAQWVGAQARGERIEAVVGGGLTLQSLQDVDVYRRDVRQSGASAGYTFGAGGPSGSASSNRSRIDSDYLSVQEQSGLFAGAGGFDVEVAGHTELTGAAIASAAAPDRNRLATGTLGFGDLANRAEYESSASGGAIGLGAGSLPIPTPVLGVSGGDEAASLTLAAVAPGSLEIRDPALQRQDLAGLSRDPEASHRALAAIFDPREAAERQELAQVFGQEAFRAVGDIASIFTRPYEKAKAQEADARDYLALKAKGELTEEERALLAIYELRGALTPETAAQQIEDAIRQQEITRADHDAWKEGSLNKTLLHGFVGALQASFGGADALSGALGAGAAEASRTLTEQLPKELQQWASAAVGAAAGAMAGGGSAGVQTGAATAWSGEVYNRQLHPKETAWIAQNAGRFAKELGISEEEAKTRLALQAAKDVDFLWRGGLAPGDDEAARVFLAKADETFLNERGNAQRLFTTELGQYFAFQQGVFDADRQFYRSYLTPNVTRDIATGAREEATRMGLDAWGAVRSDPLGVAGALASGLYEAGVAMVLDPQGAVIGAYDRFMASGQDIGTGYGAALDPALRDPLNALYGQDVSGAVAIATTANAAATVGTVFGAGKVAGIAGEAAFDAAKLASAAAAKRINEAILAMGRGPLRLDAANGLDTTTSGPVIIGETMVRVEAEARKHVGSKILNDMPDYMALGLQDYEVTGAMMQYNRKWILEQMRSGRTIIDLGSDPNRAVPSIFYQMEKNMLRNYIELHPEFERLIKK